MPGKDILMDKEKDDIVKWLRITKKNSIKMPNMQ